MRWRIYFQYILISSSLKKISKALCQPLDLGPGLAIKNAYAYEGVSPKRVEIFFKGLHDQAITIKAF